MLNTRNPSWKLEFHTRNQLWTLHIFFEYWKSIFKVWNPFGLLEMWGQWFVKSLRKVTMTDPSFAVAFAFCWLLRPSFCLRWQFMHYMCPDGRSSPVSAWGDLASCNRPIVGTWDDHDYNWLDLAVASFCYCFSPMYPLGLLHSVETLILCEREGVMCVMNLSLEQSGLFL